MNFRFLLFLYLLFKVEVLGKIRRVVGGKAADIKEFPFLVSLTYIDNNKHTCGGAIITNTFVLTAAHCVYNKQAYYSYLVIYSGSTSLRNRSGQQFNVKKIHIHPEFNARKTKEVMNRHDIAILEIDEAIEFNEYQKPAELPSEDVEPGEIATIAGWGLTAFPAIMGPNELQKASVTILDNSVCERRVPFYVHYDQLCSLGKSGVGVCVGDSGGPLIQNDKIVAIISISLPCATGLPDIYTRIYPHLDFIKSIVKL